MALRMVEAVVLNSLEATEHFQSRENFTIRWNSGVELTIETNVLRILGARPKL